jgi:hypothetical protein
MVRFGTIVDRSQSNTMGNGIQSHSYQKQPEGELKLIGDSYLDGIASL